MDHISGIAQHAAKRSLYGMKPAKYYSPVHLVEPLTSLCKMFGSIAGNIQDLEKMNIIPAPVGEVINVCIKNMAQLVRLFCHFRLIKKTTTNCW